MDDLEKSAHTMGISLSADQQKHFAVFLDELKQYNAHTNLTAIRDDAGIIKKHFIDSLSVIKAIPTHAQTIIDIGTGAGFPGLPLAIAKPELSVTLLEVIGKKVTFLKHIVEKLGLINVTIIHARAEEAGLDKNLREHFDVATARAVAELRVLVEYTLPFVKVGGTFIAQKTTTSDEIADATHALSTLGGEISEKIVLPEDRQLIVIKKISPTPLEFPRRVGIASKKPL